MSLQPQAEYCVPPETARVAKTVFPNANIYLTLADSLGDFLADQDFAELFPEKGQPAESPFRLALATILQYIEGLTDRQAADAVRSRIDWKYLLCLELTDTGFAHTVLSEFRTRLVVGKAENLIFEKLLTLCRDKGWLKSRSRQRTDSTHVLAAIRGINRLECVGEAVRDTLNALAVVAPDWVRDHSREEWLMKELKRILDKQSYAGLKGALWALRKKPEDLEPEEQDVLELLFKCSRDLRKAYALCEKLTQIFNTKQTREVARGAIQDWIAEVKRSGLDCFDKFIATLKEHMEIITNYFPHRSNSGWVEGLNNKIKVLKRRCYGITNPISLFRRIWLDLCGYEAFAH